MKTYYTYAFLREDRTPYYIGKGTGTRAYNTHGRGCPRPERDRILILKDNLTEEEAYRHEIYMIDVYGRKIDGGMLDNKSRGGKGGPGAPMPWKGKKRGPYNRKVKHLSEEHKAALSRSLKGCKSYDRTPEIRKNISEGQKGRTRIRDERGRF